MCPVLAPPPPAACSSRSDTSSDSCHTEGSLWPCSVWPWLGWCPVGAALGSGSAGSCPGWPSAVFRGGLGSRVHGWSGCRTGPGGTAPAGYRWCPAGRSTGSGPGLEFVVSWADPLHQEETTDGCCTGSEWPGSAGGRWWPGPPLAAGHRNTVWELRVQRLNIESYISGNPPKTYNSLPFRQTSLCRYQWILLKSYKKKTCCYPPLELPIYHPSIVPFAAFISF